MAVIVFWVLRVIISQKNKTLHEKLLVGFWLAVGCTWLLVGAGLFFYYQGFPSYDLVLNKYAIQPLIYIQVSFGVAYAIYRISKNAIAGKSALFLSLLASGTSLYFLFSSDSFRVSYHTFFSVEYHIHPISWEIFQYLTILGLLLVGIDVFRYFLMFIRKKTTSFVYFFTGLSMIIYSVIGFFDNQGFNATWVMLVFRLTIILGVLLTYIAYTQEDIQEQQ